MPSGAHRLGINAIARQDPTRTTALRARFVREMNRRFSEVQAEVTRAIVDDDVFGIQPNVLGFGANAPLPRKAFQFETDAEKIRLFGAWLNELMDEKVLEKVTTRLPQLARAGFPPSGFGPAPWTNGHVDTAYLQSIKQSRTRLKQAGYDPGLVDALPANAVTNLNLPWHSDRVAMIQARTFEDLKTVTAQVSAAARRSLSTGLTATLSSGIQEGINPRVIARQISRDLNNGISSIGKVRARMIARTEIIRAHHVANIAEYRQAGGADMEVEILGEWMTAGFGVCPICVDLEGQIFKLWEAEGMLPAHPNCRCTVIPRLRKRGAEPVSPPLRRRPTPTPGPRKAPTPPRRPKLDKAKFKNKSLEKHIGADGRLSAERAALHDRIIESHFRGVTPIQPGEQKFYRMTGGGTASGKSSIVKSGQVKAPTNTVTIDADEIKKLIPDYNQLIKAGKDDIAAGFVHTESSMIGERIAARGIRQNYNVFLDGTGDGTLEKLIGRIQPAIDAGYKVEANYVTVDTAKAITRAKVRAIEKNRTVSTKIIESTHKSVSARVPEGIDQGLFHELAVWDTNSNHPILIMSFKNGRTVVHDRELYRRFLAKAHE